MKIKPRYTPPGGYYIDDPSEKIDPVDSAEAEKERVDKKACHVLTRVGEWITRGRGGPTNQAFRFHIFLLCVTPQYLPTKRPSAAWVGRQHGRSRQRARDLRDEFRAYMGLPDRRKHSRRSKGGRYPPRS